MLLNHAAFDFPEVVLLPIECSKCHRVFSSHYTISLNHFKEENGKRNLYQVLLCFTCITEIVEPLGSA